MLLAILPMIVCGQCHAEIVTRYSTTPMAEATLRKFALFGVMDDVAVFSGVARFAPCKVLRKFETSLLQDWLGLRKRTSGRYGLISVAYPAGRSFGAAARRRPLRKISGGG